MTKIEKTSLTERQLKFLKELKRESSEEEIAQKYGIEKSEVRKVISNAINSIKKAQRTVKLVEDEEIKEAVVESEGERRDAKIEFVKKYRDEEWIKYMKNTRGNEAILEEAERLKNKHENDWSEFIEKFHNPKK